MNLAIGFNLWKINNRIDWFDFVKLFEAINSDFEEEMTKVFCFVITQNVTKNGQVEERFIRVMSSVQKMIN